MREVFFFSSRPCLVGKKTQKLVINHFINCNELRIEVNTGDEDEWGGKHYKPIESQMFPQVRSVNPVLQVLGGVSEPLAWAAESVILYNEHLSFVEIKAYTCWSQDLYEF